jgi:hypothetical protein
MITSRQVVAASDVIVDYMIVIVIVIAACEAG